MEPAGNWLLELELKEDSPASTAAAAKTMSVRIIVLIFLSLLSRPLAPKGAVSSWRVAASLKRCPDTKPESSAKMESLGRLLRGSERDAASRVSTALFLRLDIDLYLIVGVVEIAAGIPRGDFGLHSSLAVGGAGKDYVIAAFGRLPLVVPETPRIFSLVFAEVRGVAGGAGVG